MDPVDPDPQHWYENWFVVNTLTSVNLVIYLVFYWLKTLMFRLDVPPAAAPVPVWVLSSRRSKLSQPSPGPQRGLVWPGFELGYIFSVAKQDFII